MVWTPWFSSGHYFHFGIMERRDFVRGAATAGIASLAGCADFLNGGNRKGGASDDDSYEIEEPSTSDFINRIDFIDQAGTLGQLDQVNNDVDADDIVNEYSEEDWERMDTNDLEVARNHLSNNDSSVEQIRPWVERALNRELPEPQLETIDSPPGPEAPDERAIMYGIGKGIQEETTIAGSSPAAEVLEALTEKFYSDYVESGDQEEVLETWIASATFPQTHGKFTHLPVAAAYSTEEGFNADYVEDGAPHTPGLPDSSDAIRSAEDSVYADSDLVEYLTGFEYEKALRAAEEGVVEQEEGRGDEIHPTRAISTALLGDLWSMVDSTRNDLSYESGPPNGIVTHASKEFGRSVEQAFDNLDAEKLQYMENIGRGIQLFYEKNDLRTNLAVGGTLEQPEFYEFPDGMKEKLWNFNYDSLSALEG